MLTAREVCDQLRIDPKTLRKLIAAGEIKAMKAGTGVSSGWRISEEALAEFIKRQTAKAVTA